MNTAFPGVLQVEEPTGAIDPALSARAFAETSLGRTCSMHVEPARTRFLLDRAVLHGLSFGLEITYEADRLARVDLAAKMLGDAKGWDGWTEEGERRRKHSGEMWAEVAFGRTLEPKPLLLEDGTEIVPFERTWKDPLHLKFPGGEVISYFDSKAGFAGVVVTYERSGKGD
jgi:hypothetical protein